MLEGKRPLTPPEHILMAQITIINSYLTKMNLIVKLFVLVPPPTRLALLSIIPMHFHQSVENEHSSCLPAPQNSTNGTASPTPAATTNSECEDEDDNERRDAVEGGGTVKFQTFRRAHSRLSALCAVGEWGGGGWNSGRGRQWKRDGQEAIFRHSLGMAVLLLRKRPACIGEDGPTRSSAFPSAEFFQG